MGKKRIGVGLIFMDNIEKAWREAHKKGWTEGFVEGQQKELKFFLKCLEEDYLLSTKFQEPEKKINYIWSLIQVMEKRLMELVK